MSSPTPSSSASIANPQDLYTPSPSDILNQKIYICTNTIVESVGSITKPPHIYLSSPPAPDSKPKPSRPTAAMRVIKPFMECYSTAPISPHYKEGFILCGFPGIGKTDLADHRELWPDNYEVVELDSSKFSKDSNGNKTADFAVEYFENASELCSSNKIVLVSAHQEMRDELFRNDVYFVLVSPLSDAKDAWIERLRKSEGSSDDQVNFIEQDWDAMIDSCNQQAGCAKFVIPEGAYLSKMIHELAKRMDQVR